MNMYKLGAILFAHNVENIIEEWIAHNLAIGIHRIHVFDHMSTDTTRRRVDRIHRNVSTVTIESYTEEFEAHRKSFDLGLSIMNSENIEWCAFLDAGDFIATGTPSTSGTLTDMLARHTTHCAIAMHSATFGYVGHITGSAGLIQEDFLYRARDDSITNRSIRSIVRPQYTMGAFSASGFSLATPYYTVGGEVVSWNTEAPFDVIDNDIDMNSWRINRYSSLLYSKQKASVVASKAATRAQRRGTEKTELYQDQATFFDPSALYWTQRDATILAQITS